MRSLKRWMQACAVSVVSVAARERARLKEEG